MLTRLLPLALVVALPASQAPAATIVAYDATTLGGPIWDRPRFDGSGLDRIGTGARFHHQPFSVGTDGPYSFRSVQNNSVTSDPVATWDGALFLYEGGFDPTRPLENFRLGNDDLTFIGDSGFRDVPLTAGVQYHLVTTGLTGRHAGVFTNSIAGPGDIFLSRRNFAYDATTEGGDRWHRPTERGTRLAFDGVASDPAGNVPFHVQEFSVSETDSYDVLGFFNPRWFGMLFLYRQAFDPQDPLTNFVVGGAEFPSVGISGFTGISLEAGEPYFLVTTGYVNGEFGSFTNVVTGPGTVSFGPTADLAPPFKPDPDQPPIATPIPLPGTLPLLLAAVTAIGLAARRRGRRCAPTDSGLAQAA